jgi:hypothetical protein
MGPRFKNELDYQRQYGDAAFNALLEVRPRWLMTIPRAYAKRIAERARAGVYKLERMTAARESSPNPEESKP